VRFFFDRSTGKSIPEAFALLGIDAVAHDDYFAQATPDDTWLAEVGKLGWIVITKDDHIRRNDAERAALITYNVGCFVLMQRNVTRFRMTQNLMRSWDTIIEIAESAPKPFLYAIHADGSVHKRKLLTTSPSPYSG